MFSLLLDWLTYLIDYLYNLVIEIFDYFCSFFSDLFSSLFDPLLELLPETDFDLSWAEPYYNFLDLFFPIEFALAMFGIYCVFCISVLVVKWTLGLIPTVN